jgi:hypothetical protein
MEKIEGSFEKLVEVPGLPSSHCPPRKEKERVHTGTVFHTGYGRHHDSNMSRSETNDAFMACYSMLEKSMFRIRDQEVKEMIFVNRSFAAL